MEMKWWIFMKIQELYFCNCATEFKNVEMDFMPNNVPKKKRITNKCSSTYLHVVTASLTNPKSEA